VSIRFVSIDAEFVNAWPHGLFLKDRRCGKRVLQIDFADTNLDPGVVLLQKHLFEINGARATFRGVLKRDHTNTRVYLWLHSAVNLKSANYIPELDDQPIQLPESPVPEWPPGL
jgi:hypothetical protein